MNWNSWYRVEVKIVRSTEKLLLIIRTLAKNTANYAYVFPDYKTKAGIDII
jgi:hypothetical protein